MRGFWTVLEHPATVVVSATITRTRRMRRGVMLGPIVVGYGLLTTLWTARLGLGAVEVSGGLRVPESSQGRAGSS